LGRSYYIGPTVSVYGTITTDGVHPISNYTIDSGFPYQLVAEQQGGEQNQQLFFRATGLADTLHTLVITNEMDNGFLFLDYIHVNFVDVGGLVPPLALHTE